MGLKDTFGRWFGKNNADEEKTSKKDNVEIIEETADAAEAKKAETAEAEETFEKIGIPPADGAELCPSADEPTDEHGADETADETIVGETSEKEKKAEKMPEALAEDNEGFSEEPAETETDSEAESAATESLAEKPSAKKGFFTRLISGLEKTRKSFNDKIDSVLKMFTKIDEELFEELEEALILADVGVETSTYIVGRLREYVRENHIKEPSEVKAEIERIISDILSANDTAMRLDTTPSVIMVIGVNGVGKTTSIGKMAARYKAQGKKVILGAADTFRAAAIDQLQIWADRSGIDIVRHREGADPAAVVFDTITAAKARGADIIILDTAGRLHNKKNLMDELNKIFRVMERELPGCSKETLLVLDATTGQNAVSQVKLFRESADISGIILTKLDGSARGGIVLAIAHEEGIPVKLIGVGEGIDDLQTFDSDDFAKALFAE